MRSDSQDSRLIVVLGGVFFLSGFSALLYQVVWQRMFGLFSGSDVRSVTIVTGAYLGGLGIGSLIGSFIADRMSSRRAVRTYALCNVGIAVFAVLSRYLYYDLLFKRLPMMAESPVVVLLIAFLSLLWPTTLMGLSLPLLAKALVWNIDKAARYISRLYGINTLGAGLGALVSGWFLIGTLGYEYTGYVGAALSVLAGLIAWLLAPQLARGDGDTGADVDVAGIAVGQPPPTSAPFRLNLRSVPRHVWVWCVMVFVSGFIVISLELIWFRLLDFSLKSNAYTFAHVLAFFLIGDAAGSLVGSRVVARIQNPRRVFLWIQGLLAVYALAVTWLMSVIASDQGSVIAQYMRTADGRTLLVNLQIQQGNLAPYLIAWIIVYFLLPAIVLLIPTFMIGFYYPLVQKAIQTDTHVVGQRVGLIECANIIGNTAGSILTGTLLLQVLGTVNSLRLIGMLGFIFLLVLLREQVGQFRRSQLRGVVAGGTLAAALLVGVLIFPSTDVFWANMHGGTTPGQYFAVSEDSSGVSALSGSSTVVEIAANGRVQGSIPFYPFHAFLGAMPVLVHPHPEQVLIIGIGSGGTPWSAGIDPRTKHIDAVEIVGSELDVLKGYAVQPNGQALKRLFDDPRYHLVIGDGRRELVLSHTSYDVIVVDAVLPWTSHAGLLYSQEFYQSARARLADDGIMVQWRPTDRMEASFVGVFPYVLKVADIVLIGSSSPIPYDKAALLKRLTEPSVVAYLKTGGVDPESMRYWIEIGPYQSWTPQTPRPAAEINTDLFPKDEQYLNNALGPIHYPKAGSEWFTWP